MDYLWQYKRQGGWSKNQFILMTFLDGESFWFVKRGDRNIEFHFIESLDRKYIFAQFSADQK
jgi:hypothetical protein